MARGGAASQWANQAALNALLRYRPQKEGLAELIREAHNRYHQSVSAGQNEGLLASQAAQKAIPAVKGIYDSATAEAGRGRSLTDPVLSALSATSPFRAAAANEQAAGAERLATGRARAESDVQAQGAAAAQIPAFTRQAAMTQLVGELQKLNQKGSMLQGAEGADTAAETQKLRGEAGKLAAQERRDEAQRRLTERGQNLTSESAAAGRQTTERGQNLTNTRAQKKAEGKELTPAEQRAEGKEYRDATGTITQIRHYAGELGGVPRAHAVSILTEGKPQGKSKKGNPIPAIPQFKPDALMAAALDLAEEGQLTRHTEARLRSEYHLDPAKLGVPLYAPGPHGVRGHVKAGR